MNKNIEDTLKLALEALEEIHVGNMTPMAEINWNKAITALRAARASYSQAIEQAQPSQWDIKQDPVGVVALIDGKKIAKTTPMKMHLIKPNLEPTDFHIYNKAGLPKGVKK